MNKEKRANKHKEMEKLVFKPPPLQKMWQIKCLKNMKKYC